MAKLQRASVVLTVDHEKVRILDELGEGGWVKAVRELYTVLNLENLTTRSSGILAVWGLMSICFIPTYYRMCRREVLPKHFCGLLRLLSGIYAAGLAILCSFVLLNIVSSAVFC